MDEEKENEEKKKKKKNEEKNEEERNGIKNKRQRLSSFLLSFLHSQKRMGKRNTTDEKSKTDTNLWMVAEEHHETIDSHPPARRRRQPEFQSLTKIFVRQLTFVVFFMAATESLTLFFRIVQLCKREREREKGQEAMNDDSNFHHLSHFLDVLEFPRLTCVGITDFDPEGEEFESLSDPRSVWMLLREGTQTGGMVDEESRLHTERLQESFDQFIQDLRENDQVWEFDPEPLTVLHVDRKVLCRRRGEEGEKEGRRREEGEGKGRGREKGRGRGEEGERKGTMKVIISTDNSEARRSN